MSSSIHLRPQLNGRHGGQGQDGPKYYAPDDKRRRRGSSISWSLPTITVPGARHGRRLWVPNLRTIHQNSLLRYGRKRGSLVVFCAYLSLILIVFAFAKRFGSSQRTWPNIGVSPTLVYKREDLQRIWLWEIASGHHPSRRQIPKQLGLSSIPPAQVLVGSSSQTSPVPRGPYRDYYLDIQSHPPNVAYPPRPIPGSIADLDVVMEHCDFTTNKYVRDCLEVLRVGAGLDNGNRVRRKLTDSWRYIYVEGQNTTATPHRTLSQHESPEIPQRSILRSEHDDEVFVKSRHAAWEPSPIALPTPKPPRIHSHCNPDESRIFHMYWTGPFTDKPYLTVLSFLFTQNVDLHQPSSPQTSSACRPKLWLWINPGPAAAVADESTHQSLFEQLRTNVWASPFLHPRFDDIVQFKLWNTTEQLDSVAELKDEWRNMKTLFKSEGYSFSVRSPKQGDKSAGDVEASEDMASRTGSKSSEQYDRLSVIMSDMARFILCHRFGGIYLDTDTVFLRDWEELWGWKGAFAYKWSFHDRYNTAVLRLNKGSALGTFLLRTALKNDLDFHPKSVTKYLKDARMEELLFRIPDALFDSAWLNMENFQRERPPQPYFSRFEEFFETPPHSGPPLALGFDGFFRGAFSYHFHNSWWTLADPSRNWPDLGPKLSSDDNSSDGPDPRDLGWATVLKRTFEAYIRGERPNMYGEWLQW